MQTTVRKHNRIETKTNGFSAMDGFTMPRPVSELMPHVENLLQRETPHAPLSEYALAAASVRHAAPAFRLPPFAGAELQEGIWTPPVNCRENNDEMILEAYIPGVAKSDILVEIKNGSTLVIKGERKLARHEEDEKENYQRKEFSFRRFYRSFALPLEIDPEGAVSNYRDGVLEITLQKKAAAKQLTYRVSTAN